MNLREYDENFGEGENYSGMDGLSTFDPSSPFAKGSRSVAQFENKTAQKLKDAVITLRIQNKSASTKTVELFNTIKHITKVPNTAIYGSVVRPLSINTLVGVLSSLIQSNNDSLSVNNPKVVTSLLPLRGVAFWDDLTGNLVYNYGLPQDYDLTAGANGVYNVSGGATQVVSTAVMSNTLGAVSTDQMIVSCSQLPYRQLVDNLGTMILNIRQWKIQTSSENQIKNAFRPYLYGDLGVVTNDSFEPSEFFQPENQQTKLINMTRQMWVDKNTAIYIDVEPLEDMQITLNVSAYRDNALMY
jgi:hypothetical protein